MNQPIWERHSWINWVETSMEKDEPITLEIELAKTWMLPSFQGKSWWGILNIIHLNDGNKNLDIWPYLWSEFIGDSLRIFKNGTTNEFSGFCGGSSILLSEVSVDGNNSGWGRGGRWGGEWECLKRSLPLPEFYKLKCVPDGRQKHLEMVYKHNWSDT